MLGDNRHCTVARDLSHRGVSCVERLEQPALFGGGERRIDALPPSPTSPYDSDERRTIDAFIGQESLRQPRYLTTVC
jgi:hypothetical protein